MNMEGLQRKVIKKQTNKRPGTEENSLGVKDQRNIFILSYEMTKWG